MKTEVNNRILSGFVLWMMIVSAVFGPMLGFIIFGTGNDQSGP